MIQFLYNSKCRSNTQKNSILNGKNTPSWIASPLNHIFFYSNTPKKINDEIVWSLMKNTPHVNQELRTANTLKFLECKQKQKFQSNNPNKICKYGINNTTVTTIQFNSIPVNIK